MRGQEEMPESAAEKRRMTAVALAIAALVLVGIGLLSMGLSKMPHVLMSGFGFMYSFMGMHIVFLGLGTFVAATLFAVFASPCFNQTKNS